MNLFTGKNFAILKDVFLTTCNDKKHFCYFCLGLLFLLLGTLTNVAIPIALKTLVDGLSGDEMRFASILLLGYGGIWTLGQVLVHVREMMMNPVIERCTRILTSKSFAHLYGLTAQYHVNKNTGELSNALSRIQMNLPIIFWAMTIHLVPLSIELLLVLLVLIKSYSLFYVSILFLTLLMFSSFTLFFSGKVLAHRQKTILTNKIVDSKLIDWLQNLELVRIYNKSSHAIADYKEALVKREQQEVAFLNLSALFRSGQVIILGIGLSLLTWFMGKAVKSASLSLGDFVLLNSYFMQFIGPMGILGFVFKDVKRAMLELTDVFEILNIPMHKHSESNLFMEQKKISLEFKNVSFKYGNECILKNLTFTINAGETVAIMGKSGSGKSTILKLILRSLEPCEGHIFINGLNIQDISPNDIRNITGFVPQENNLLNTTIFQNISFFAPELSYKDIEKAAGISQIQAKVESLPSGFNSLPGERGAKLSGGERQRIALARVFAKNPPLCLFDEPTSALDKETEELICSNIKTYLKEATKIIVTHSPLAIKVADRVIHL